MGSPISAAAHHVATPTMPVEITVPTNARRATGTALLLSLPRSTCSAPANNKNASIPSITTVVKSI